MIYLLQDIFHRCSMMSIKTRQAEVKLKNMAKEFIVLSQNFPPYTR
jgi:hypothetical protein